MLVVQEAIIQDGGVEALVKLLEGGPVSAGTAAAMWALMELCVRNPDGQQALEQHGGLQKVRAPFYGVPCAGQKLRQPMKYSIHCSLQVLLLCGALMGGCNAHASYVNLHSYSSTASCKCRAVHSDLAGC